MDEQDRKNVRETIWTFAIATAMVVFVLIGFAIFSYIIRGEFPAWR